MSECKTDCKRCVRKGIAILPVLYAVAPKEAAKGMSQLGGNFGAGVTDKALTESQYILRSLPAGYLYLLAPNNIWRGYQVDSQGGLQYYPNLANEDMPDAPLAGTVAAGCSRQARNAANQTISIDGDKGPIWVAFSRHKWTKAVRKAHQASPAKRMTKVAALDGSEFPHAVAATTDNLDKYVASFNAQAVKTINKSLPAESALPDRSAQSMSLPLMMTINSGAAGKKNGLILALHDPIGITTTLNAVRNAKVGELASYQLAHGRERMIGDVILGFEQAFKQNGQAGEWEKRYVKKHYDKAKLIKDKTDGEKEVARFNAVITKRSADVYAWNNSAALLAVWHDFDPANDASAQARQIAFAGCIHGMGKTKAEQTLWNKWLADHPNDPYSPLWGAFTAMNPNLGEFLLGKQLPDTGKWDKFVDFGKNLNDIRERLTEILKKRQVEEANAIIGTAVASQLTRLAASDPALYRTVGARVMIIAVARTTVTITPVSFSLSETQHIVMLQQAVWGPPKAGLKRLLDAETQTGRRVFIAGMDGTVGFGYQQTSTKMRAVEMWLPQQEAQALKLAAPKAPLLLSESVNPVRGLLRYTKSLPGGFAWVGLVLQAVNLNNTVGDMTRPKADNTADAWAGMVSGVMGVTGATTEIVAGAMSKMATRFAEQTVGRVAFGGGVFAGLSGVAEGVQMWFKALDRKNAEDSDAKNDYYVSSAAFIVSGIAGFGGALAIGASADIFAGTAFAFLAPTASGCAAIPVVGWIALGVIAAGVGVYFAWQALKDTDTALEVWLGKGYYGKFKDKYASLKLELAALNDITYDVALEVEWKEDDWELVKKNFYDDYDKVSFKIRLPAATAESVIRCKFTLKGKAGSKLIFDETIRPVMRGGQAADPHVAEFRAASNNPVHSDPPYIWWVPPRIASGSPAIYTGELRVDDSLYSSADIELEYWPDQAAHPELILPADSKRISTVKD